VAVLGLFVWVETKVAAPMFRIPLFRTRSFAAGNVASLMAALGRGGLMFILIIWLQGIWLPEHGYSFAQTPLWAGIFMLPLTGGFLLAGPVSGYLSDRYGARPFATGGMLLAAVSFALLELLPVDFGYVWFALLILLNGAAMGLFASPNRAAIMNSLPPGQRGQGSGMVSTTMNAAMVLSIGIFFTLIIVGLSVDLPTTLYQGLTAHGVPAAAARKVADLPPTSSVFAAFLGYNPVQSLLGPSGVLAHLSHAQSSFLTGRSFFPNLIAGPFSHGLDEALDFAAGACLVAAGASAMLGKQYFYQPPTPGSSTGAAGAVPAPNATPRASSPVLVGAGRTEEAPAGARSGPDGPTPGTHSGAAAPSGR
jgi:MFS family permease